MSRNRVFWLITGLSLISSIIMMFTVFIFWLAFSRVYGLAGMHLRSDSYGTIFYKSIWPTIPETRTRDFVLSVIFVRTMGIDTPSYGWGGNLFGSFGSYRMASLTGVSNKDIFKTLMAVIVIVPIITLVSAIMIGYGFGTRVWYQSRGYGDGIISHLASAWYYNEQPAAGSLTEPLVVGFVIAGALSILHSRFVWFPFEPIGWILGWSYSSILFGYWLPFLIAWVIKFATLRIGGSKAYESTGLPLFGGIAGGCMLGILVGGIIGVFRFFVPF